MLSISELSASIGDKPILKGINLEVPAGEIHAIMGPNGSGKSTLGYVLAGREEYVVTGGTGPPLLLVHGWPQTWYAWRLVMPALARQFTVVAPVQREGRLVTRDLRLEAGDDARRDIGGIGEDRVERAVQAVE